MTLTQFRRLVAQGILKRVEDAVIEGDFESAGRFADELLNLACALAVDQLPGYREVLAIAEELQDVKGFPFST